MGRASIGGRANWSGAAFELRLGVEFCLYILIGERAGLGPGALRSVQLQAPEAVDDVVLEFETGARWAIQAKAGKSVRVGWGAKQPFGKALRQLYQGATSGQIDLAAESIDRVELAVDHTAAASVTAFGKWLEMARQHYRWDAFAAACTGEQCAWAQKLPAFLKADPGDDLLAFLKKCHVRPALDPDSWRSRLRGRLIDDGVPADGTPDLILDALLARVAEAAPHAGQLDYEALRRACESIPHLPRPGMPPFRLFHAPTEDDLYAALRMPAVRPARFVARPELTAALGTEDGLLVAGRPGGGKSHALIKLALAVRLSAHDEARPDWPVLVIDRAFRADDLGRLAARLRRVHTPYQLLWDDVQDDPGLFADAVARLADRGDRVRVLAAYRDQHESAVQERVTPDLCRRAGVRCEPLRLRPFDADQSARMAQAVIEPLALSLDEAAQEALARHICEGDGGPFFALAVGLLLRERAEAGEGVRAADVARLPADLLATWRALYDRLAERPQGFALQGLLDVCGFLHRIACPLDGRLVELLFVGVLEYRRGEFDAAGRALAREGWLRREGEDFAAHDLTLEALPAQEDLFRRCVDFARGEVDGEPHALGLLRDALGRFFYRQIPWARRGEERRQAAEAAAYFGARAIDDFRAAESSTGLSMASNNASVFYSELAGLEESREGRAERLRAAVAAIEEAVRIRRALGLQADLAMSLNNASNRYSELAGLEESREGRAERLRAAVAAIEEAVTIFRSYGIIPYLIIGLMNAVRRYLEFAECTGELDRERVLALCREGEALCGPMQDRERLAFFQQARQELE